MMTRNEHAIWAACFSPLIFVQRCVSLPSFVVSQRREVYSCGCCTPANHYAIRVILPNFSPMGLYLMLLGTHITLGSAHSIRPQYRYAMSNTLMTHYIYEFSYYVMYLRSWKSANLFYILCRCIKR